MQGYYYLVPEREVILQKNSDYDLLIVTLETFTPPPKLIGKQDQKSFGKYVKSAI